jgi:hypothetical protein
MATLLSSIESQAREHLKETTASFWTSAELIDIINKGIKDLWGAIIDINQEHFLTVDVTNVSLAAEATSLTGVPTDVYRVYIIEPRDTTVDGSYRAVVFEPRKYNSHQFANARAQGPQDAASGLKIYYSVSQAGAPVGAPTILTAPMLSAALPLRFVYVPVQAAVAAGGNNPIPGESDNALIAWCVAYARAKEREDRSPDPNWLAVYATEKQNILVRCAPRQQQEPEVVDDYMAPWME